MHGCGHIVRGRTGAQQWTLGCAGLTKVEQSGLMDQFERDQSVPGMRKARPGGGREGLQQLSLQYAVDPRVRVRFGTRPLLICDLAIETSGDRS